MTSGQMVSGEIGGARTRLDLTPLENDWISITALPGGISRVRLRRSGGTIVVRAYGAGDPTPVDWGEAEVDSIFADAPQSKTAQLFTATFDRGPITSHLQTNQAHGVLAVHASHRFTDGSGRRDYFTREFYGLAAGRRSGDDPSEGDASVPSALRVGPLATMSPALKAEAPPRAGKREQWPTGDIDPSELLGTWTGLDSAARISTVDCVMDAGQFTVRAYGLRNGTRGDWGVTHGHLYADGSRPEGPPAFLATFDRDDQRMHLQARKYMGVLVVGQYTEFADRGGLSNYYIRECYRR